MRSVTLLGAGSFAVGCLLTGMLLAGCAPAVPVPRFTPVDAPPPRFANDAEALAAAEEAYGAYIAVSDQISQDGGHNPERILPYVSEKAAEAELASFELLRESNRRTVNSSRFFGLELRQVVQTPERAVVTFWVCDDVSDVRILDADDHDVTTASYSEVWQFEVEAEAVRDDTDLKIVRAVSRESDECER